MNRIPISDSAKPFLPIDATFPLSGMPLADQKESLQALMDFGFGGLWTGEANGFDAVGVTAAAATWLPTARIGTSVMSAFTRSPGILAMSAATLAALAPGRVSVGLGASSPAIVRDWNGLPYERPYSRVRDVLRFLRQALDGERVSGTFATFGIKSFRLAVPPSQPPDLLLGALRPRMLRLAAEEADGAIVTWLSPGDAATVVDCYRSYGGTNAVAWLSVCPSSDNTTVRNLVRPTVAAYLNQPGYAQFHQWLGRGPQLTPIWEAWAEGDRVRAIGAVSDDLIDELFVHGTPDECVARIQEYLAAGVSRVIVGLQPVIGDSFASFRDLAKSISASASQLQA